MVMYKIDRRGGGSKNRSLGNYPQSLLISPTYLTLCVSTSTCGTLADQGTQSPDIVT